MLKISSSLKNIMSILIQNVTNKTYEEDIGQKPMALNKKLSFCQKTVASENDFESFPENSCN